MANSEPPQPERFGHDALLDLYRIALDEYRFQLNLNWQRTQHWFTLNAGIAAAAVALLHIADDPGTYALVATFFGCGVATCGVAVIASFGQHGYYRSVRDHKTKLEEALGLGEFSIQSTPGMRGESRKGFSRILRVTSLYVSLLTLLAVLDAAGAVYAVGKAVC